MSRRTSATGLIISLVLCYGAAAIGGRITTPAIPGWYAELEKPAWTPPAGVFGPVWSLLYTMMAIAAWRVWVRLQGQWRAGPLQLFLCQLALNVGWSALFFGAKRPDLAFAEILVLWGAILGTLLRFRPVSGVAAGLLVPYLLWVTFAAALNFAIWRRNA